MYDAGKAKSNRRDMLHRIRYTVGFTLVEVANHSEQEYIRLAEAHGLSLDEVYDVAACREDVGIEVYMLFAAAMGIEVGADWVKAQRIRSSLRGD